MNNKRNKLKKNKEKNCGISIAKLLTNYRLCN